MAKDTDLDPLRDRADFKKLLASLQPKPKGNAPPREPRPAAAGEEVMIDSRAEEGGPVYNRTTPSRRYRTPRRRRWN